MGKLMVGNAQQPRPEHKRLNYLPLKIPLTQSSNSSRRRLACSFKRVPKQIGARSLTFFTNHSILRFSRWKIHSLTLQLRKELLSNNWGYVLNVRSQMGIMVKMPEISKTRRRLRALLGCNFWSFGHPS